MAEVDPRDARIAQLEAMVAERDARIAELMAKVETLTARVAELEVACVRIRAIPQGRRLPMGRTKRQQKRPTGRRPGGQAGHKKHERALLPREQVQRVVEVVPEGCQGCKRRLRGQDSTPRRHQVVEVPPLSAFVTEYRCQALRCPGRGVVARGEVPAHARSVFGDRLAALASLWVGKYRLSKRLVKDALSDMLGVELSVGSVSNLEGEMSQALAPAEALASVRAAEAVNADETGFTQGREGGRAWGCGWWPRRG